MSAPFLEIRDLTVQFGAITALSSINLVIQESETIGLIGSNGAGKTTLTKCVVGALPSESGAILIDGKPVTFSGPGAARLAGIECVFQTQALVDDLSVVQNIFLGREICGPLGIINTREMRREARALFAKLGIPEQLLDRELRYCSGGERQIVALSKAFYFQARLLFLDEPLTALSIQKKHAVLELLSKLKSEHRSTIVMISHDLAETYALCDRFVIMNRGAIVRDIAKSAISYGELEEFMRGV
ncbi:MAG: ATP-binding cassette domain-containing protein [Pseudomonadota bacterium]|jgi:ABC-type sugar transport system ATPase subunit